MIVRRGSEGARRAHTPAFPSRSHGPRSRTEARRPSASKRRVVSDEALLVAIVEVADDGFCPWRDLIPRFRPIGDRDLRRSIDRAVRRGLLLERRGPDGRSYVALTAEGWDLLRTASAEVIAVRDPES